jgi:hypothetical protein
VVLAPQADRAGPPLSVSLHLYVLHAASVSYVTVGCHRR